MDQEIFEKEIAICREGYVKNGGKCNWGECAKCGVVLLLYKIYKGEFLEKKEEIEKVKKKIFDQQCLKKPRREKLNRENSRQNLIF